MIPFITSLLHLKEIILDGNSEHIAHACMKENYYFLKKIRFMTSLGLDICLKQIKLPRSLHTCAPIAFLPSNISTTHWPDLCELNSHKDFLLQNFAWRIYCYACCTSYVLCRDRNSNHVFSNRNTDNDIHRGGWTWWVIETASP